MHHVHVYHPYLICKSSLLLNKCFLLLFLYFFTNQILFCSFGKEKSSRVMWLYHIDTGTALHVLLDVTLLDILYPTVFSIQAMGILVLLLLYVLLSKSQNSCRLSLQLFSKDARQILGTRSLGLKFNQTSLLSCSNCQKII